MISRLGAAVMGKSVLVLVFALAVLFGGVSSAAAAASASPASKCGWAFWEHFSF